VSRVLSVRNLAIVATLAAAAATLPASAGPVHSPVGSASVYGLDKNFTLVGHTDLQQRGMNSPLAVAGRCVYVGDRYYDGDRPNGGIAIVDAADPANPQQVGRIAPVPLSTQREMRVDARLGILVVESYSPYIDGAADSPRSSLNNLKIYDIHTNCLKPKLLSTYNFGPRAPHEFFLWKDPKHPGRALAYVTFTIYSPDLMVIDLSDPVKPRLIGAYDLGIDQAKKTIDFADESGSGYLHSISVTDDGTRAYISGWDWGMYVLNTSMFADPIAGRVGVARPVGIGKVQYGHNVHSVVKIPGRPYVVMGQEDYANAGHGCPFGYMRTADVSDPANPKILGSFKLPENDPNKCGQKNGTFSSHNQTVFPDVALMSWYADKPAGRVNTARPLPTDTPVGYSKAPRWTGAMWSYPVVQNGLIYVVDIDLGLYILRYTGAHADEVAQASFVEGNSAPSAYGASSPVPQRPAPQWQRILSAVKHGATVVQSPYQTADVKHLEQLGFVCL
jgi:hypothetical protein